MFRDFSFDTSARNPPLLNTRFSNPEQTQAEVSPTSSPPSELLNLYTPASTASINQLQDQFNNHHISTTSTLPSSYYSCYRTSSEVDEGIGSDMFESYSETSSAPSSRPVSGVWSTTTAYNDPLSDYVQARRHQRQHGMRFQCTEAHTSRLNSLLETMITSGDQCRVRNRAYTTSHSMASSVAGEDLEVDPEEPSRRQSDCEALLVLSYRRSGECSRDMACVSKDVRLRKRTATRRKRRNDA